MSDDATKKTDTPSQNEPAAGAPDKIEELQQKPITDSDANAVKGGKKHIANIKWV